MVVLLVGLLGGGAIWQSVATAQDRRAYPPPGQLVDVDAGHLHLFCAGTGSPTVVLEAASAGLMLDWAWVQPEVEATTRVCAYDRAGRGWSQEGPAPRDATRLAHELCTALAGVGERGPYVLVGHSAGGLFVRQFAAQYPDLVAGMVLLDASHPAQATFDAGFSAQLASDRRLVKIFEITAHVGGMRLLGLLQHPAPNLPPRQRDEYRAHYASPRYWASVGAELAVREATNTRLRTASSLSTHPLIVVTAGVGSSPAWLSMQTDLLALSTDSKQRVVAEATHLGLLNEQRYARESSAAIVAVVEALRRQQALNYP